MNKAVFLDRDGVINKNVRRLDSPEKFVLIDGAAKAISHLKKKGYLVIVVTNQPEVAKGFFSLEDVESIHKRMKELLAKENAHVDAVYTCPHHPEKGFEGEIEELKIECDCRKPKPGMLLKAIKEYNIDPAKSWMIGDSKTDIEAGKKASVQTVFLTSGGGSGSKQEERYEDLKPDYEKKDLEEAINTLF
ncbi:MAG: HAD family hydrolase [Candidatus Altiarchaeota archaeon]